MPSVPFLIRSSWESHSHAGLSIPNEGSEMNWMRVNARCWIIEFLIYRRLGVVHVEEGERRGWLPAGDSDSPPPPPYTTFSTTIHHTPPSSHTEPPATIHHIPMFCMKSVHTAGGYTCTLAHLNTDGICTWIWNFSPQLNTCTADFKHKCFAGFGSVPYLHLFIECCKLSIEQCCNPVLNSISAA